MKNVLKPFRYSLVVISLIAGFSLAFSLLPTTASAIDIFNNCTKINQSDAQKANCQDCASTVGSQTNYCKEAAANTSNPVIHIISIIINIVSFVAGIAAIIALIVSGLRFMLSNGDSNSVAQARNGLLYALIGIGVVVLAQGIVVFVLNKIK